MAFCSYEPSRKILTYASAKLKVYLVRNGNVRILEKDECSVGAHSENEFSAHTHMLQLRKGDRVYLLSDGLVDQFGGENDKRFGSFKLKNLLAETSHVALQDQKEILKKNISTWKGTNEQTDDITVMAFQID